MHPINLITRRIDDNTLIHFRQEPNSREIRVYRYINNQLDSEICYPLKGKYKYLENETDPANAIRLLWQQGRKLRINARDEITWSRAVPKQAVLDGEAASSASTSTSASSSSIAIVAGPASSSSDSSNYQTLPTIAIAPLKPLNPLLENPLYQTHPLGFPLGALGTNYYKQHSDWCERVLTFPGYNTGFYKNNLADCLEKMGLSSFSRQQDKLEEGLWATIIKKIEFILSQKDMSPENFKTIPQAILEINKSVYTFIFRPIESVNYLLKSNRLFLTFIQRKYREYLENHFPERNNPCFSKILLDILYYQISNDSSKIEKFVRNDPDNSEKIRELSQITKIFVKEIREEFNNRINNYFDQFYMIKCWEPMFQRYPYLRTKYERMIKGSFSSSSDMGDEFQYTFPEDSYLSLFAEIIEICEEFMSVQDVKSEDLIQFQQRLKESTFSRIQDKIIHFRDCVEPLVKLRSILENFTIWPGEYELSKGEKYYLSLVVYQLSVIANKKIVSKPLIPYDYHAISREAQEQATRVIENPGKESKEKRKNCRLLFHSQIPWKAILSVASLAHGSGGIETSVFEANKTLLEEAMIDLIGDFRIVDDAINDLLNFELTEFEEPAVIRTPQESLESSYPSIRLLGDQKGIKDNLEEICLVGDNFLKGVNAGEDRNTRKFKYAILRALQVIGELAKNLRHAGLVDVKSNSWNCLEELRDMLSHLERPRVKARLDQFLERDLIGCSIDEIIEDLTRLTKHFENAKLSISQAKTWAETKGIGMKEIQDQFKTFSDIILEHLENVLLYFTSDLSIEDQEFLRTKLCSEDLRGRCREIHEIKQVFLSGGGERDQIRLLPLKNQKEFENLVKKKGSIASSLKIQREGLKKQILSRIKIILDSEKELFNVNNILDSEMMLEKLNSNSFVEAQKLFNDFSHRLKELISMGKDLKAQKSDVDQLQESGTHSEGLKARISNGIGSILRLKRQLFDPDNTSFSKVIEKLDSNAFEEAKKLFNNSYNQLQKTILMFKKLEDQKINFEQLLESEGDFKTSNDSKIRERLDKVITYEEGIVPTAKGVEIIKLINRQEISPEDLEVLFMQLGFDCKSERIRRILDRYKTKRNPKAATSSVSTSEERELAFNVDNFKRILERMIALMQELDSYLPADLDIKALEADHHLVLARQYLYSNFRSYAIYLEGCLDQMALELDHEDSCFFQKVRQGLLDIISHSNDLVHMHTVTEVSSLTTEGKTLVELLQQIAAVKDIPIRPHVELTSLKTNLEQLLA